MKPEHFTPNKYRGFDATALTCSTAINATLRITPRKLSADAWNLNTYLATWWNAQSGTGSVHPSDIRIQKSLGLSGARLEGALNELEDMGWWKPARTGEQTEYKFLLANHSQAVKRKVSEQGGGGISMNHTKFIVRYIQCSPMAKALMLYILSQSRQNVVNLQYQSQINAGRWGRRTKLFHGTLFTSPHLNAYSPADRERIAKTFQLPEEWTVGNPIRAKVTLADFSQKVDCSRLEWNEAIREIEDRGLWSVFVDPFSEVEEAVFTPTYELHKMVWKIDQIAGGKGLSEFEARLGFDDSLPDTEEGLPTLGYHFVYTLRQKSTGRVLMVGQTTQPLNRRLNQHLTEATNSTAHQAIKSIVANPGDSLEIVHESTVHFFHVAKIEVDLMGYYETLGEKLLNVIRDEEANRRTIKPDARFGNDGVSKQQLEAILAKHGGQLVINEALEDIA